MRGLKAYTYSLSANGKIESEKLKSDGVFDEKSSKYRRLKKFTMPNLAEGCVIEYRYTLVSPFIQSLNTYKFQESIPIKKAYLRFAAPEYINYKKHQRGWVPFKIEEDISVVNMTNVSSVKEEKYTGNIDNYLASLKFELAYTKFPSSPYKSYTTTWDDVSETIYQSSSFGGQIERVNYFKSELDPLIEGVTNPEEKMMRIFEFAKSKMTWNSIYGIFTDEGVKDAYKKGSGNVADLNLSLTGMFRYAGLNANPVLLLSLIHI